MILVSATSCTHRHGFLIHAKIQCFFVYSYSLGGDGVAAHVFITRHLNCYQHRRAKYFRLVHSVDRLKALFSPGFAGMDLVTAF
jgi:hypothetical protein